MFEHVSLLAMFISLSKLTPLAQRTSQPRVGAKMAGGLGQVDREITLLDLTHSRFLFRFIGRFRDFVLSEVGGHRVTV